MLGGYGHSGTDRPPPAIVDYANNDRWWDDTSDGPVTARVVIRGGTVAVDTGLGGCRPAAFRARADQRVTLYDTMFDTAVRGIGPRPDIYADGLWQRAYRPSWEDDVRRSSSASPLPLGRGHPSPRPRLRP